MKNLVSSSRRSQRRHQTQVRRARAMRLLQMSGWPLDQARKNADHIKKCSCFMCGNFRRNLGPNAQEQRLAPSSTDEN